MTRAPAFMGVRRRLVQANRRIRGAIERTGMAWEVEHGWQGLKGDFGKSLEVEFPREEALAVFASLLFAREKMGDATTPLMASCVDTFALKLASLGEDIHALAKQVVGALRGSLA